MLVIAVRAQLLVEAVSLAPSNANPVCLQASWRDVIAGVTSVIHDVPASSPPGHDVGELRQSTNLPATQGVLMSAEARTISVTREPSATDTTMRATAKVAMRREICSVRSPSAAPTN